MRQCTFPGAFSGCRFFAPLGAALKANRKTSPPRLRGQRSAPTQLAERASRAIWPGRWHRIRCQARDANRSDGGETVKRTECARSKRGKQTLHRSLVLLALVTPLAPLTAWADETSDLKEQIKALTDRLNRLEAAQPQPASAPPAAAQ